MGSIEILTRATELANTEPDEAMRMVCQVLNKDFDSPEALFLGGYVLFQAERVGMAYQLFRRVHELKGDDPRLLNNLGQCFDGIDYDKAIEYFSKAQAIDPENLAAISNCALMYLKRGEFEKAEKKAREALRIENEYRPARDNLGLACLAQRKWKEGWRNYAYGLGNKHRKKMDYGLPDWDGESPGHVVIYGEQGIGDEIMFASCIPDALERAEVTIDCDSRLAGVFRRSFGCDVSGTRYAGDIELQREAQYQCSIGELPRFYRNKHAEFPGTAYLKPDPERVLQWKSLLETYPGRKIGIAWSGGVENTGKARRSITLDTFAPLFDSGDTYISLEYKKPDQSLLDKYGVKHWDRATLKGVDYDETLALIEACDLIISVTTTVIYGAGALGKECWCLVPNKPSYRYHTSGDLPWFKSVKLMRQETTWEALIEAVKKKLGGE